MGECARAPGLAAGAAGAEEEGGGSRHPDPIPLLLGPPSRPAASPSPGGPGRAHWPSAREPPPEPGRVYVQEEIIQEKEEQADQHV